MLRKFLSFGGAPGILLSGLADIILLKKDLMVLEGGGYYNSIHRRRHRFGYVSAAPWFHTMAAAFAGRILLIHTMAENGIYPAFWRVAVI